MTQETVNAITFAGREVALSRPVRPHLARRLIVELPRLNALNAAHKSQADAAYAMQISVITLRTWIAIVGIEWANLNKRHA